MNERPDTPDGPLPIRHAAAIVVHDVKGLVLIGRRNHALEEFGGVWSFPSIFVEQEADCASTLAARLDEWFAMRVANMRPAGQLLGMRPRWRLMMHLFTADAINGPVLRTEKYDRIDWVDGVAFFGRLQPEKLGECARAYLAFVRNEKRSY
jgi:hypothetical protein